MTNHRALGGLVASALIAVSGFSTAAESGLAETVRSLIGFSEFLPIMPAPMGETGCINLGGGLLLMDGNDLDEWSFGEASCKKRTVILLKHSFGSPGNGVGWRIVDAFLLPALRHGDELFQQGDCEVDGKTNTSFVAIVHLGRRDRVDHRNGVLAAWTVDPQAGKIVALDTKRVVCYPPTPP